MSALGHQPELALPGVEQGTRTERVEWGLMCTEDGYLGRRGHVDVSASESSARWATTDEAALYGHRGQVVVSRTVVTYTAKWARP